MLNQAQGQGRTSPLPPVPQLTQSNLGQPGQSNPSAPTSTNANTNPNASTLVPSYSNPASLSPPLGHSPSDKGPDYVYFERKPNQYGEATAGKAMAAKMRLELFYKEAVEGVVGRKERWVFG